jgi:hypothetical protein
MEFQGQVNSWINAFVQAHPGLGVEGSSIEFKNVARKRADLIIWQDRTNQEGLLAAELKNPRVPLSDIEWRRDVVAKAHRVGAKFVALWNMQTLQLFRTPDSGDGLRDADHFIAELGHLPQLVNVDDWLLQENRRELERLAIVLLRRVCDLQAAGVEHLQRVDATVFVDQLAARMRVLRQALGELFTLEMGRNTRLRRKLEISAQATGVTNFVTDLRAALGGQLAYRLLGQTLFYLAFRRYRPELPELLLPNQRHVMDELGVFWSRIRRFDYEALYETSLLDEVPIARGTQADTLIRDLVAELGLYDWRGVDDAVLGSVFEQLIPEPERVLLGQYYTPYALADLMVSLCLENSEDVVLDPAVGTGTFLVRAHSRLQSVGRLHEEILEQLWGVDISAFAAELSVINLCRLDLSVQGNFPRVAARDFFTLRPDSRLVFPPARRNIGEDLEGSRKQVQVPEFDVVLGNPPYVRLQKLDDTAEGRGYLTRLKATTARELAADAYFDAFAYFIVHAKQFLRVGGRLAFVTSAAWLTSNYGGVLQRFLLEGLAPELILYSEAEPFFPATEVNTVVVLARRLRQGEAPGDIRFVTLTERVSDLVKVAPNAGRYWETVDSLADSVMTSAEGVHSRFRTNVLSGSSELSALQARAHTRNWARPLKVTPVYQELFRS